MSMLLLIGLVTAEMDEKGYHYIGSPYGWVPKDFVPPIEKTKHEPFVRKKRPYKR